MHENGKLRQIWQQCNLVVETSITINVRMECCVIQLCVCISCCWIWNWISELLFCISVFAPMQSAGWCGVANVELNYGEIMQEPTNQPASIVLSHSQHQSTNSVDALCVRSSWHLLGENSSEFQKCAMSLKGKNAFSACIQQMSKWGKNFLRKYFFLGIQNSNSCNSKFDWPPSTQMRPQ